VQISGADNATAAGSADAVLLTVPYDGHAEPVASLRAQLAGKVVLSCVNPLGFDKRAPYSLNVGDGSAAEKTQRMVPGARPVGALTTCPPSVWTEMELLDHEDVLVRSDDVPAKTVAIDLALDHRSRWHRRWRASAGPEAGTTHHHADQHRQAARGPVSASPAWGTLDDHRRGYRKHDHRCVSPRWRLPTARLADPRVRNAESYGETYMLRL
jgi:hypothetical protein